MTSKNPKNRPSTAEDKIILLGPPAEQEPPAITIGPTLSLDGDEPDNEPLINNYRDKHRRLVQLLRQTPILAQQLAALVEGRRYQVCLPPEVWQAIESGEYYFGDRGSGALSSTIHDAETGKIVSNVSLREVSPDFLTGLNQLAIHQTLADITCQLEVIDLKISEVLQGQHLDRLAEVLSGVEMYQQAIATRDKELRRELLVNAIQQLNGGRRKLLLGTEFDFVDALPKSRLSLFLSPRDWPAFVEDKAKTAYEAMHGIIKASRYLAMAYTVLEEPDALRVLLQQAEKESLQLQEKIREIVPWLDPTSPVRSGFYEIATRELLSTPPQLQMMAQRKLLIEIQPEELTRMEIDQ